MTKFSKYFSNWTLFTTVMFGIYVFLCIVNWEFRLGEWGGFSRFVLATAGLSMFIWAVNDNHDIAEKYRADKEWEEKSKKTKTK